ncbi:MAG: glycosyltransferase family 4 protein [Asticcacaulis sp.]
MQVVPELNTGGVEQTTVDMARALSDIGARALVASAGGRLEDALKDAGGMLIRLPMQSKNPLVAIQNGRALKALIRAEGIDLVHVRSRAPAFATLWAARATGTASVTTYHGIYNGKTGLKRWYNGVMTRADLTIANSDFTRAHVLAAHPIAPDRVISIPRGVDLSRFNPEAVDPARVSALLSQWGLGPADGALRVLLAGRLTRWKGQELLIDALAYLRQHGGPAVQLVLAGDDQGRSAYTEGLKARIESAGLTGHVALVGHCSDMPAAYLATDVAAAPSLDPEAFGRTAVEPQAMGRPVLAADHGATRETVVPGETGWLVPPGDVPAWAEALRAAAGLSPAARAAMGRAGQAHVAAQFSVAVMCARTLAVYARLLSQSR